MARIVQRQPAHRFKPCSRSRHQLVNDELGFPRNAINDVVDADRLRDVVDEEDQPADGDQRQQHGAGDGEHRHKGDRKRTRSRQRCHTVGEGAEEYPQRPLRSPVAYEADQDARRELRRGQRQRHQQDGEDDGDDSHDRGGDGAQYHLRDLRVLARWEQRRGNPCAQRRHLLLERGQHAPNGAQHQRYEERSDQEAAAQPIGDGAEQQGQSSVHRQVPSGLPKVV